MSRIEQEVAAAFKEWKAEQEQNVDGQVMVFAWTLASQAITERQKAPGKHNFTGNLLNSIAVCIYKDGAPDRLCIAGEWYRIPKATHKKMTAPKKYHFKQDYDGAESNYKPEIETNQGWGVDDAREFFRSFNPGNKAKYWIVVAYPTEYASFVEQARHTTGIYGVHYYAKKRGWRILGLPWTYGPSSESTLEEAPF